MAPVGETTIRVPSALRDHIRTEANARGLKQADLIELALRELEQADFLKRVAGVEWDDEALAEAKAWDDAAIATALDPWVPTA